MLIFTLKNIKNYQRENKISTDVVFMKALDIIQTINKFGKTRYFKGFLQRQTLIKSHIPRKIYLNEQKILKQVLRNL